MTKENWEEIYRRGEQLNRYPYEFVVSNFYHYVKPKGDKIKVLDLGCGGGNHTLFCAENGCDVVALDYSVSALKELTYRARKKGLNERVTTLQGDLENLVLQEGDFDLVIDRLSVSNLPRKSAKQLFHQIYEHMAPNGILLSCLFSDKHAHMDYGDYIPEKDVWMNFSDGIFEHLLASSFYSEGEVRDLFSRYVFESLCKERNEELHSDFAPTELWKIVVRKGL